MSMSRGGTDAGGNGSGEEELSAHMAHVLKIQKAAGEDAEVERKV
jgi:hypothetical protein